MSNKIIKDAISEMSNSFVRGDAERDLRKEIIDKVHDETGIEKKMFRKLARLVYKNGFEEAVAENEELQKLYVETVQS